MESEKVTGLQREDIYKRINFLYQAAYKCLKTSPEDLSLCRYYIYTLNAITKRLTLHFGQVHFDPGRVENPHLLVQGQVKKTHISTPLCFNPAKRQSHAVVTCIECGTFKRYLYIPDKDPWLEKEENWIDVVMDGVACKQQQTKMTKKEWRMLKKQQKSAKATKQTTNLVDKDNSVKQEMIVEDGSKEMNQDSIQLDKEENVHQKINLEIDSKEMDQDSIQLDMEENVQQKINLEVDSKEMDQESIQVNKEENVQQRMNLDDSKEMNQDNIQVNKEENVRKNESR